MINPQRYTGCSLGIFSRLALMMLLAACASGPQVRSDFDPEADFSRYRTFAFVAPAGTDRSGYSTLLTERLKRLTRGEMELRGYIYQETAPDLLVNFSAKLEEKIRVLPGIPAPGYYGYRGGMYGPWPGYGWGWDWGDEVVQYTEGTVNVDLVDARRHQLVWEGVGIGVVSNLGAALDQSTLRRTVTAIFARYPFVAGSAVRTAPDR